jgi:capsid protein
MAKLQSILSKAAGSLSPQSWGPGLERSIAAAAPSWAANRAAHRMEAERLNYLAATYKASRPSLNREARSTQIVSESGQLTDADWANLVAWSEETYRNNPIMSGFIRRGCDSIIGTGLDIMPDTGDSGLDTDLAAAFQAYCARGGGWEATGRYSQPMAQRIAFTTAARSGDLLMYRADDGWQFFEAGQIGTPYNYNTATATIEKGVELDARGRAARYHVAKFSKLGYVDPTTSVAIRADKCVLIGHPEFFSGARALPIYHNSLVIFDDVKRYFDSELLGAITAACVTGEMKSPDSKALDALSLAKRVSTDSSGYRHAKLKFSAAQIIHTRPGEEFKLHAVNRPSNMFPEYIRINFRLLGFPIGLPLELSVMDFTESNFAAAKMAIVQAAITHMVWRQLVIYDQMLKPVYLDFLDTQRAVKIPDGTKKPRQHYVIEPITPWLEEYKESQARNAQLEGGWNTLTNILRQDMNRTLESVYNERVKEILLAKEKCKAAGLPDDHWEKIWKGMMVEKAKANPDKLQAA